MVKHGSILQLDGKNTVLVASNETFNDFSRTVIVCPIGNADDYHPFHIKLSKTKTTGVIKCDQVWTASIDDGNYEYIEIIPEDILLDVIDILNGFTEKEKHEGA